MSCQLQNSPFSPHHLRFTVHYLTQVHDRVLVKRMGSHRMFVLESICAVLKCHSMQ